MCTHEEFGNWLINDQSWELMVVTNVIGSEYIDGLFVVHVLAVPEDDTLHLGESKQVIKFKQPEEVQNGFIFFGFI